MNGKSLKFAALLLCAGVACSLLAADQTVTNKDLGIEVVIPEKWSVRTTSPGGLFLVGNPEPAPGPEVARVLSVRVFEEKEDVSLQEYAEGIIPGLKQSLKSFEIAEKLEVKLGSNAAFRITYFYDHPKFPSRMKGILYILANGRRTGIIGTSQPKDEFAKYAKEFDAIVQSFKLLKKD